MALSSCSLWGSDDTSPNTPPEAVAGGNQSVFAGTLVSLNGSASSDRDGDPLTYAWSFTSKPSGSSASISNDTSANAIFTPDVEGNYTVQLIVHDGKINSVPSIIVVIASIGNRPPVANAGLDQAVTTGTTVNLDGNGSSDPDGNQLIYAWSMNAPTGSAAAITNATSSTAYFVPDVDGSYYIQLVVNDGSAASTPDTTVVTAAAGNRVPLANAGPDKTVTTGTTVNLDGNGSTDPDGNPLTYAWSLTRPAGSLAAIGNATSPTAYVTPDVDGSYYIQLIVNDGIVASTPDTMMVTAVPANRAPVADAGPDLSATISFEIPLDGHASFDPDGNTLTFAWSLVSLPPGSAAPLTRSTFSTAYLTPDLLGSYTAQLVVNDGMVNSNVDTVVVTANNRQPFANAGVDQSTTIFGNAPLNAGASFDPDGNPLTYLWSMVSMPPGSTAVIFDATAANSGFTPDVVGTYTVRLVVNDGMVDSIPDTMVVTVTVN
ncbi:MAG: hypothetical protein HGA96_09750 [Desulfobulbaceae bacterium]|nr:hypothetical protein [Desulfobulbaceae bacterium]